MPHTHIHPYIYRETEREREREIYWHTVDNITFLSSIFFLFWIPSYTFHVSPNEVPTLRFLLNPPIFIIKNKIKFLSSAHWHYSGIWTIRCDIQKTLMCRHANQKGNVKSAYISSDPTIFTLKLSLLFFWQLPHWGSDSFSIPSLIPYENFTSDWFESIKKMNVTALQLVTSLIWFDKWCWIWRGH